MKSCERKTVPPTGIEPASLINFQFWEDDEKKLIWSTDLKELIHMQGYDGFLSRHSTDMNII